MRAYIHRWPGRHILRLRAEPGRTGDGSGGEVSPEITPDRCFVSGEIARVLFDAEAIDRRLAEMGSAISRDYAGLTPVLVAVLKGGAMVLADLARHVTIPVMIDFIAISSYGPEARGVVRLLKDLGIDIAGKHVLVVEDVIDTGLTLNYLLRTLRARRPASLEVATLFDKRARRLANLKLRYSGFELPDEFVVGYGLDVGEKYRNLPFVCTLKAP